MIVRVIIILLCLVFFINGCNSLFSQFFGTQKLRSFDMETVAQEGIGDADYVEIKGARFVTDFVYHDPGEPGNPPILLYPVFAGGEQDTNPIILAWTADFFDPCVEADTCISAGIRTLEGVVRPLPRDNRAALGQLREKGYKWAEPPLVINHNEAPVNWYWNALMMLGAAVVAIGMEAIYNLKKT